MMRLMLISSNVFYSLKPFIYICLYSICDVGVNHCISEHMEHLEALFSRKNKSKKWIRDLHNKTFIGWLRDRVSPMYNY